MDLPKPLISGRLLRRYKRFLADIELDTGEVVTAHCPNSGSMESCATPGQPVLLSHHADPRRKLAYTWQLYHSGQGWVCVNTQWPNNVVAEGIRQGRIPELAAYAALQREVKYADNSRIDILLTAPRRPDCYVEVKQCTLLCPDNRLRFPDAVTARGIKHLHALLRQQAAGSRAVLCFLLGRKEGVAFAPADAIHPEYGRLLRQAARAGVEILAYRAAISPDRMEIAEAVTIEL